MTDVTTFDLEADVAVRVESDDPDELREQAENLRYIADELDSRAVRLESNSG